MKYRYLGNSGLQVSEISLGSWLTYGNSIDRKKTQDIMHTAYDLGINYFDTANVYALGEAEKIVGEVLGQYPRDSYVLASKAFFPMSDKVNHSGLSRKHITEQVHASLKRLNTEYLDIFYCHRFDPNTPLEETLRTIDDLVRQGKILYAGVSEWTPVQMAEARQIADKYLLDHIVVNQPLYNMLKRDIEAEIIPFSESRGISQVVFSPIAQGVLTGKYKKNQDYPQGSRAADSAANQFIGDYMNEKTLDRVEKLNSFAQENGWKLSQLALAWVLRQQNVASTIVGASRPEQLYENIEALDIVLNEETLKQIDQILAQ